MEGQDRHKPDYNIKMAAEMSGTTPNLIRAYERMGLIKPYRNPANKYRFFTLDEVEWLSRIKKLISQVGLNIEGIKCILTIKPCWEQRDCTAEVSAKCPARDSFNAPCWSMESRGSCCTNTECYKCGHYVNARNHWKLFCDGKK